ncbi:MAG: hypothetical protein ABSH03_14245 [Candidatus Lustribacter sp.]|jgi:hypothetical protein
MSVNPAAVNAAAAAAANSSNAAVEALIAAELNALAADAQALQGQVTTGQVVTAQVLPSNGMTDLIQILGNRVAAALPPGLGPGDVFTAQVTGFNGPQILLQVLNTVDPAQVSTTQPPPGLPSGVVLPDSLEAPPSALELAATRPVLPEGVTPSSAPPPAVFVAGSIRPADPVTMPPAAQVLAQPLAGLADIEARLAAARAGAIGLNGPAPPPPPAGGLVPPPPAAAPAPAAAAPPAPAPANTPPPPAPLNAANAAAPPPPLGRFTFAPPITPSARFAAPAPAPATPPAPAAGESETPAASAPPSLNAFRDPAALVRALNLPVTPTNIAAARLAITTPQRLPVALATLESALPGADDPRVTTLRTMSAFIGRMEPSSPQLAAQISAFVDNVVTGNEPKLVQLLAAQLAAAEPEAPPPAPPAAPAQPGAPAAAEPPAAPVPPLPVVALAQVIERGAALTVDLKTQLLNVINAPPAGSEEAGSLVPAASSALTAITAVQINAAQAMNASPQTMAFTLPMWLGNGYAQAHIAIDRDAPEPGNRNLDGDNFHIAFILDTANLGTVSVDLQTVGRSFSLAVKTENEGTAKLFASALTKLTSRLETLRYRVNSAEASVAPRGIAGPAPVPVAPAEEPEADDGSGTEFNARA